MDSIEVVTEERAPLLNSEVEEILPCRPDAPAKPSPSDPIGRLVSLDVFRGLTIALMILVDDAGGAFPAINHSPWFGVTLADFVMPFFLFGVGVSIALVFKKTPNKVNSTKKVLVRTVKLFLLGLVLQGGYFHGRDDLSYGVDIDRIRWLGVLQRISIGYFLAAMSEIWLVNNISVDSPMSFVKKYCIEWVIAILLSSVYISLVYALYVPNWAFEVPSTNSTLSIPGYGVRTETVQCGVRGSLEPPCNAVGLIDRLLLGERHLYQRPVYRRTQDCSVNSPDYGPLPPNSPVWCLAPFDPEGILSSLMASITCFAGLHFGHFVVHYKSHVQRMLLWSVTSLVFLLCGYTVQVMGIINCTTIKYSYLIGYLRFCFLFVLSTCSFVSGMPFSKPLYTLSYMFLTTGVSGFLLTLIYYFVDTKKFRTPFILLQWMGMNALIVYALAACELFPAAIQGFYWRSPSNNLVSMTESLLQTIFHSKKWGKLAFVLLEILFWCLFAGFLHINEIYFKL